MLAAIAATVAMTSRDGWVRSNVFELLPRADHDRLTAIAADRVERRTGTQLIFLVGHADRERATAAAGWLADALRMQPLIETVTLRRDSDELQSFARFYGPYRRQMLSVGQQRDVAADPAGVERDALASIYSPFGGGANLGFDPFGLFPGSLRALRPAASSLEPRGGYLWARDDDRRYVLLTASLVEPTLSIADQRALAGHVNAAVRDVEHRDSVLDVLETGFVFYANEATQKAKGEISTIGLGSLLGLLLLVVTTFRSLRPLSLIVISVLSGCAFALAVTLVVFGQVHLFTLVFGASLIGVCVDYSFHYVADDAFGGPDWTPRRGISNIFAGITLGLATSVLAYLALTVAPFPGLQQLAVFSSTGLAGAWLTLLAVCGWWRRRLVLNPASIVLRFARGYLDLWARRRAAFRYGLVAVLGVAILAGYPYLRVDDNVSALQARPAELVRQENEIRRLLGIAGAGTFLVVRADSDDALLRIEENVRGELDALVAGGDLAGYEALSRFVPSAARQRASYDIYTNLLRAQLPGLFGSLDAEEGSAARVIAELTAPMKPLELEHWLADPVSAPFRDLFVRADGIRGTIVPLYGVDDLEALTAGLARYPAVAVVNKAREMSDLFGRYRVRVAWLLAVSYVLIFAGLAPRYGPWHTPWLLIPPVAAGFLALIAISLAGESLNLFHFLAMILVLGIGIDFTLFVAESHGDGVSTMFAVTLSALTTTLSFGLLSLSATYAVHSFGLTVLIGIACAYLLSPLAIIARVRSN